MGAGLQSLFYCFLFVCSFCFFFLNFFVFFLKVSHSSLFGRSDLKLLDETEEPLPLNPEPPPKEPVPDEVEPAASDEVLNGLKVGSTLTSGCRIGLFCCSIDKSNCGSCSKSKLGAMLYFPRANLIVLLKML